MYQNEQKCELTLKTAIITEFFYEVIRLVGLRSVHHQRAEYPFWVLIIISCTGLHLNKLRRHSSSIANKKCLLVLFILEYLQWKCEVLQMFITEKRREVAPPVGRVKHHSFFA